MTPPTRHGTSPTCLTADNHEARCRTTGSRNQVQITYATELINSGVSIEVVRRRLGHASTETTQVYTLLADKVADTEIRAARRKREMRRR